MSGISNHEFISFFGTEENEDIQNNIFGVFSSNFINCFISFHSIMKENKEFHYPFLIMNTDRFDKKRHTLVEFS